MRLSHLVAHIFVIGMQFRIVDGKSIDT